MKTFAPQRSAEVLPELYARRITLREGVKQVLAAIPTHQYAAAIDYVNDKPVRPGFKELVDFLEGREIPLHVISGGLWDMVVRVLSRSQPGEKRLIERVASITAVKIDTSGEYLRAISEFEGETELVAKVRVMEQYPAQTTIAIGDSLTDLNLAKRADIVFARDPLSEYLEAEGKAYFPWGTFYDVRDRLASML